MGIIAERTRRVLKAVGYARREVVYDVSEVNIKYVDILNFPVLTFACSSPPTCCINTIFAGVSTFIILPAPLLDLWGVYGIFRCWCWVRTYRFQCKSTGIASVTSGGSFLSRPVVVFRDVFFYPTHIRTSLFAFLIIRFMQFGERTSWRFMLLLYLECHGRVKRGIFLATCSCLPDRVCVEA